MNCNKKASMWIKCSENHLFLTDKGWIKAKDLTAEELHNLNASIIYNQIIIDDRVI